MELTPSTSSDRSVTICSSTFLENLVGDIRRRPALWRFIAVGALAAIAIEVRTKLAHVNPADAFVSKLVASAFGITSAIVVAWFIAGHLSLVAKRRVLTFATDGVHEWYGGRSTPHEWDSLLEVSEDDLYVAIVFDSAYSAELRMFIDKRSGSATVASFFELCAEHADPEIARFARKRIAADQ